MLTLEHIADRLHVNDTSTLPEYDSILRDLKEHKLSAVREGNQALAKQMWCFEQIVEVQVNFLAVHELLRNGEYYEGWCKLEQIELVLLRLYPHFNATTDQYWIGFIAKKIPMLQSLFPYRMFTSPEILEIEKKCNICGEKISIRNPCGHRVGEIYDGKYCCRIVTKCEFIAVAMVTDPVQKYSVVFPVDPKTGKSHDRYNYSTVEYLIKRWPTPFHDWTVEWTKALHPKKLFGQIGRNDKCPCDSGVKYKKCCMHREGILRPHCQFTFNYSIPEELQVIELSY